MRRPDPWRDDVLGMELEAGFASLRESEPSAGGWDRLAAVIEAEQPIARRWPDRALRVVARVLGERALAWPLREFRLRGTAMGAALLMIMLTTTSVGSILVQDQAVPRPEHHQAALEQGGLDPFVLERLGDGRPVLRGDEVLTWVRATARAQEAERLRTSLHARIGQHCSEVFDHPLWSRYDSPECRAKRPGPSPLGVLLPLDRLGSLVQGL